VTMSRSIRFTLLIAAVAALGACAQPPLPSGTNDPFETVNRAWFDTNLALERRFSGDPEPQITGVGTDAERNAIEGAAPSQPSAFRRIISNFGSNLSLPSTIVNDVLQIRPDHAAENTLRLVINTTIGLGGLFDPAGALGIHGRTSDFGETLHRWGVGEGAYMVLPVAGPTTERDAAGMIVDIALNPLRHVFTPVETRWSTAARLAARLADRAEYADLLDANVINTSDPYAQARLLYLQTRRYHLGIENDAEVIDPYADF
jgi:phospholipid-binding lipoprotein MlaA